MSPERIWYGRDVSARILSLLLAPLGWVYCAVAALRAFTYRAGWLHSEPVGVPVIVVGNLTVGGTGKTPLALWLVAHLLGRGLRPGIAMRGYGGSDRADVRLVPLDADPRDFGDEPVLLAKRAGCPVVVGSDRVAAGRLLVNRLGCDLVVTDDGLQHYRLRREVEILVVDGARGFGNARCLPAGPLREPLRRAYAADLIIANVGAGGGSRQPAKGQAMQMFLLPGDAVNLCDEAQRRPLCAFATDSVVAVAGIGNPARFFAMLRGHGLKVVEHAFSDHHRFSQRDLARLPQGSVLMTEKDAVKCRSWAELKHWYVPVQAQPDAEFVTALDAIVDAIAGTDRAAAAASGGSFQYDSAGDQDR